VRRGLEPLRPINLPDLAAAPSVGRRIDAARERVAATRYESADLDLGSGTFGPAGGGADTVVSWEPGDRVRHRRYGTGTVVSSQIVKADEEVTVNFDEHGQKYLIAAYAGLEREEA
jgi:DNA helicase-2/ATP-dependent DNA helicase PcrA